MSQILYLLEKLGIMFYPFSLFLLFFSILRFIKTRTSNYNLPPSLPKLPIIGNLHQLGLFPHRALRSFAQSHGPLMLLHLGSAPTVVVSSAKVAREIMKTHDLNFSSRPDSSIANRLFYDHKDLAFAPYGEYWRQMRRICILQLLSTKRVQSFRAVREEETALVIENIEYSCSSSSALVNLSEILGSLTNDILCRVAFGRKYSGGEGQRSFKEMAREVGILLGVFDVKDFIPWLAWVNCINGLNARVEKNFREIDCFLDGVIKDHINLGNKASDDGGSGGVGEDGCEDEKDLVEILLGIQKDCTIGVSMDNENIKAIILDMFFAGTDTTSAVIEWAMAELLRHPEVMKEVQDEVRGVARGKPIVTEDDVQEMNYLKAVIKEILRLHPPVPLLVQRESTEHVKIQGYNIPHKTRVITNAWAIGRDPVAWEEAEEFRPKRFLNSSIDFKGHDFEFIPFGAGRRGCPGIGFAVAVNEVALANLLNKFNWAMPGGASAEDLDMTESYGMTVRKKSPLLVVASPHYR